MIDICLLGTGGMMPLPDRALTSLYVRHGGRALLIDCGEGTQTAIRAASMRFRPIDAILITHFHADHVSGLPGLLLTIGNEGRTEPLHIYGPEGLADIVRAMCVIAPELPFAVEYHEFTGEEDALFPCIGLEVQALSLSHRIPCFGYRFDLARNGKFDPERAKKKNIPVSLWGRLQKGESVDGFIPEDVLGTPRRGLRFLYATDTRPVPALAQYGREADLLILEGIFGAAEKQERAETTCHMMMQEAAAIAAQAGARELWLTHLSPATRHPEEFIDALQEIFANTVIGKDGMFKTLEFEK